MSETEPAEPTRRFIFLDPRQRRWPRIRRRLAVVGLLMMVATILFLAALWVRPELRLPSQVRELKGRLGRRTEATTRPTYDPKADDWRRYATQAKPTPDRQSSTRRPVRTADREVRLGLFTSADANAIASLHDHANQLTHVAYDCLAMSGPDARITSQPDLELTRFCANNGIATLPILKNELGGVLQPEAVENLARGPAGARSRFIAGLDSALGKIGATGVLINWSGLDPAYIGDFSKLVAEMASAIHASKREVWMTITMDDEMRAYELDTIADHVDHFVAMMVDEHADGDDTGPLASLPWFEGWLQVLTDSAPVGQWVLALGSYGLDWNTTTHAAKSITFRDAMSRGSYAGVEQDGISVNAPDYNGSFDYSEAGGEHTVYFLDAPAFYDLLTAARSAGFHDFGLYSLGTEDPAVWPVLARDWTKSPIDSKFVESLRVMKADDTVTHVGVGEIVTVDLTKDDGLREMKLENGKLSANYTDFPTYPALYHQGAADLHAVALTFDDGPDPKWTPKILEILKEKGAKAAFFVVGKNAEDHPRLVQQIVAEGHEIGNHTYTHLNLVNQPAWRVRLELDATEQLIESLTGRGTALFRPPYNADSTPSNFDELVPLQFAERELGYTVVMETIDPQDWARPGADAILQRVKESRITGNVILLHDAGGDRSQTVEALPRIIDWLRERGDQIVPLSELLKLDQSDVMPPVVRKTGLRAVAAVGFHVWHWFVETLWAFMIVATGLVVVRSLIVVWLAWQHRRREKCTRSLPADGVRPPVSVLISAYNEEKVVARTLESIVESDYPGAFEIVIVDDGSADGTAAEIERIAAAHPCVRLVRQTNAGKSAALRRAISQARHDVIVFLDADTQFERRTISALVDELLSDARIGAVSGQAKVGNARNFITRCQALEYLCGFNLDRRAFTVWNCTTVVPGAVSAFRKAAIDDAGGFSHDTLAEDTDMTLQLHRLGWRISYASEAVAWTEAPENFRGLLKQRFRWAFGTMQCLWKHRDLTFNPKFKALGFFSLPGVWFFQVALVSITPPADIILLWSIFAGYAATFWPYFAAFLGMDLLLAVVACLIEGESVLQAFRIIPMRFVYRWLLACVIWKAILTALKGALVGWGKLERTAAVLKPT